MKKRTITAEDIRDLLLMFREETMLHFDELEKILTKDYSSKQLEEKEAL